MNQLYRLPASRKIRVALACIALLNACAQEPGPVDLFKETDQIRLPPDFPVRYYRNAQAQGRQILQVDPKQSVVVIDVGRGGALARLGHDHVVASHDVQGYVDPEDGRADLVVPLDRLAVDEPHLRAEAKLDTQPSVDDIAGTRRNMLTKVLDVHRYPTAAIHVTSISSDRSLLRLKITLHGTARSFDVPVGFDADAAGLTVSGRIAFNQTDFGIVPLSVLGGALQVKDQINLRFRIRALAVEGEVR